jgi:hypothetical protein
VVVDTLTLQPITDVFVYISGIRAHALTDEAGQFLLPDIDPGTHTLLIRKPGFVPREYRFALGQYQVEEIDLGVIALRAGPEPTAAVFGTVSSMLGGPISRASVILNGRVATVTDAGGSFRVYGVGRGLNLIETQRLGYVPGVFEIDIEPNQLELEMTVGLYPAPVQLEEIVVSAARTVYVAPRLREFYERRSAGWGSYFSRWEIENLAPISTTDLLQRVPRLLVTQGSFGFTDIRVARGTAGPCAPRIFLDGVRMRVDADFNLDNFVSPFDLEGIEVYVGPSQAPLAYLGESSCGVILIWTQ